MEGTSTAATQVSGLMDSANAAIDGLLQIGTKVFTWALDNPLFVIGIIIMIVFVVISIVKSLSHR